MEIELVVINVLITCGAIAFWSLLRSFLPSYVSAKGTNLATKEDISAITSRIESVRAQYAESLEALRVQLAKSLDIHRARYESESTSYQDIWEKVVNVNHAVGRLRPFIDKEMLDKLEAIAGEERSH